MHLTCQKLLLEQYMTCKFLLQAAKSLQSRGYFTSVASEIGWLHKRAQNEKGTNGAQKATMRHKM